MKTPDALYNALEAVSGVHKAMSEDVDDPIIKPKGTVWLKAHYADVGKVYKLLECLRDSLDETE